MPHIIVEYSANLDSETQIRALVKRLHEAALETGLFPLGGVRTRAARRDIYEIADGHSDNAFIHVLMRMGAGREEEEKNAAGQHIFDALTAGLEGVVAPGAPLAVSLEMVEIDPRFSFKKNNLHECVKQRKGEGGS